MPITYNFPTGVFGNVYCYKSAGIAYVLFDGFTCSSTSWQYEVATGFPRPTSTKWMLAECDGGLGPVKVIVTKYGALGVRCTQYNGSNHLIDATLCYPIV